MNIDVVLILALKIIGLIALSIIALLLIFTLVQTIRLSIKGLDK